MVNSTTRAFGSPFRYIQGPGEIMKLGDYMADYGTKAFLMIDGFLYESMTKTLKEILEKAEIEYTFTKFSGECSEEALAKFKAELIASRSDILVGIGGGKAMDTAKIVAAECGVPRIIVPTSAASDAPTASMSVLYKETGEYHRSVHHKRGTELVVVDSQIIANAPERLFAAGIADALATWYEARANDMSDTANYIGDGYRRTLTGMAIAERCYETLMSKGLAALRDIRAGALTETVEDVIEANILMSGLGFENTGCAGAHSVHTGAQNIPETRGVLHGEMVSFGILFQLVLEKAPKEEVDKIANFLISAGLPVTLEQIGVKATKENLDIIAERITNGDSGIDAEPFCITEQEIRNALISTDAIGKEYLTKR